MLLITKKIIFDPVTDMQLDINIPFLVSQDNIKKLREIDETHYKAIYGNSITVYYETTTNINDIQKFIDNYGEIKD